MLLSIGVIEAIHMETARRNEHQLLETSIRRTKIVCTIGPSCEDLDTVRKLAVAGMNVARLNFSHGTHADKLQHIENVRQVGQELGKPIAILQDLCGPKIRLGVMNEPVKLVHGDTVQLSNAPDERSNTIPFPSVSAFKAIGKGHRILIDDGKVELVVVDHTEDTISAQVVVGGTVSSRKGVNLPDSHLPVASVTSKDLDDLRFGIENGVDWVAVSFIRSAADLSPVIQMIRQNDSRIKVIGKIEKREAVLNLEEIMEVVDGIMIARGDLGVEIPIDEVPVVQKHIIEQANAHDKIVITATQMLESMMNAPRPTRAEASDVANSILDGTDAVMLSGETAAGMYPVQTVEIMSKICARMELSVVGTVREHNLAGMGDQSTTEAVAEAIWHISHGIGARAIACATQSGGTARLVSKRRPHAPIVALTPDEYTYRQLALSWGVRPLLCRNVRTMEEMLVMVTETMAESDFIQPGDTIVITAGIPVGVPGRTNFIKVHTMGDTITV